MSRQQFQCLQIAFGWTLETFWAIVWPFVRLPFFVHLSVDEESIWQKSFVLSKYSSEWNVLSIVICQQFWQYRKSYISAITFNYFPNFWDIGLACCIYRSSWFCSIFNRLCASMKFLSSPTNCLIRYVMGSINFLQFSKNLLYRMAVFCANFYIALISLIFSTSFPTIFTTVVNDWLCWNEDYLKTVLN